MYNWQTQADYERTIREVADDIVATVRAEGREEARTFDVENELQSWCDDLVTYTGDCLRILLYSCNEQAFMDAIGEPSALVRDGQVNYPLLAYCAVQQDIRLWLDRLLPDILGGTVDDDTFWQDVTVAEG